MFEYTGADSYYSLFIKYYLLIIALLRSDQIVFS